MIGVIQTHVIHYFLSKTKNELLDRMNEFMSNRQKSGIMVKEYKKWYKCGRENSEKSRDDSLELGRLWLVMFTVILGDFGIGTYVDHFSSWRTD